MHNPWPTVGFSSERSVLTVVKVSGKIHDFWMSIPLEIFVHSATKVAKVTNIEDFAKFDEFDARKLRSVKIPRQAEIISSVKLPRE